MKKAIVTTIGCSFLLSGCLIVTPKRNRGRQGVHRNRCHPSEYWDGRQCKHKGKKKGHHKRGHKHDHRN